MSEAIAHCRTGASVWSWASIDEGVKPDVMLVGIGDNPTVEVLAAAHILRAEMPYLRMRLVNVTDLPILEDNTTHPHGLDAEIFNALFTPDLPVIINFHGYPSVVKQLNCCLVVSTAADFTSTAIGKKARQRHRMIMYVRNRTSRYHLIMQEIRLASAQNPCVAARTQGSVHHYEYVLQDHQRFIQENGDELAKITNWQWC